MRARRMQTKSLVAALAAAGVLSAWAEPATAQEVDIEVPTVIIEQRTGDDGGDDTTELDLANIVQSAAKGVTTVQEAPAIVTVITSDEIQERGHETFEHVMDGVPGWLRLGAFHSQYPFPLTRGTLQAMLFMHNGVSLHGPVYNTPSVGRVQALETIKRIEVVTGPGGVLWGANSYMGVVNIITKDADDVDGVEANVTLGHGDGDRESFRGYVMAGIPRLFSDDSRLFLHGSVDSYYGPAFALPQHAFATPLPQPNTGILFGPRTVSDPERSLVLNFDGKLSIGKLSLYFQAPYIERHAALGISGFVPVRSRVEDTRVDPVTGELLCPFEKPFFDGGDQCLDKGRVARDNGVHYYDRYVVAEYRTRLADGKAGATIKGYAIQFVRDFDPVGILSEVEGLLEGGLAFTAKPTVYRTGFSIDADIELPYNARLLYGAEAFYEWLPPNDADRTRQRTGVGAVFTGPYQLERLPLPCPRQPGTDENGAYNNTTEFLANCPLTFMFETSRMVMGAYVNPQWKVTDNLTIDGGVRLQAAPASLGVLSYDLQNILSTSAVYGFMKDWHLKLGYTEGFRAGGFNQTDANGEAVNIGGVRNLKVESSSAYQAEVNARIFKGRRRIRELSFRADYSYSNLKNLIQVIQGNNANVGERGIHSAEFLGKLYIQGGHRLELSYTWLRIMARDKGRLRQLPEHWFNLAGVFKLSDKLLGTTNFRIIGAHEDANRLIEYRGYDYNPETGRSMNLATGVDTLLKVNPHEVTLDLLPPAADITLGLNYYASKSLRLSAFIYNALNASYFQPDAFADYEPRLEFNPNPIEAFRFKVNATYTY